MANIPRTLKSIIPIREIVEVEDWWNKLSDENQSELASIYHEETRKDDQLVSIYLCGKFVEQEHPKQQDVFWVNHFYDYIINHELYLNNPKPIVGGICSANEAAKKIIKNGVIPIDFICPVLGEACQMMKILNLSQRNQALHFYIKFKLE